MSKVKCFLNTILDSIALVSLFRYWEDPDILPTSKGWKIINDLSEKNQHKDEVITIN